MQRAGNTSSGLSQSGITWVAVFVQRKSLAVAASLHDPRYKEVIDLLVAARIEAGLSQDALARRLGRPQSYIGKIETHERRLDALELFDLLEALGISPGPFAIMAASKVSSGRKRRLRKP